MAVQNPTVNYSLVLPTVGGSADAWGTILNQLIGDDGAGSLDSILKAISDVADAALPAAGGTVTGAVIFTVTPQTDAIAERTAGAGVTIDGLLIKDGAIAIAGVTGLQSALDAKAASSHTHAISDVTGLQSALDGKAASSHTHAIANVTGLQTALDGKASTSSLNEKANLSGATFTGTVTAPTFIKSS